MSKRKPTWDVVATVDEFPVAVQAMVAWHIAQGAAHIFLFCDWPKDPVAALLSHLPQVSVIQCDADYWQQGGLARPARHEERQVHNANVAYQQSCADWIIHIDADEYIWAPQPIAETLADVPTEIDGAVVGVAERMHRAQDSGASIFEGCFRRPFHGERKDGRSLFGRAFHMTYKGLLAHAQGKVFVRTGRALSLSIHRARPEILGAELRHARLGRDVIELLHFDGLTLLHWGLKLGRMIAAEQRGGITLPLHRQRQVAAFLKEGAALYPRVKGPIPAVQEALASNGLLAMPLFDPAVALADCFPDQAIDLRPEAADQWLQQNRL